MGSMILYPWGLMYQDLSHLLCLFSIIERDFCYDVRHK